MLHNNVEDEFSSGTAAGDTVRWLIDSRVNTGILAIQARGNPAFRIFYDENHERRVLSERAALSDLPATTRRTS